MKFLQVTFILPSRTLSPCESEVNDLLGGRCVNGADRTLAAWRVQRNLENRFTGWVDVPLSAKGEEEAPGRREERFNRTASIARSRPS